MLQTAAKCSVTGPFYPVTETYLVANGIGFNQDILLEPDWLMILTLLGSAFIVIALMTLALVRFYFLYTHLKNEPVL